MKLGIDATNIRAGGGLNHLVELLRAADPQLHRFSEITVWGNQATLVQIDDRGWLSKCHEPMLDRGLAFRIFWQRFVLSKRARSVGCDVLFVPGGSFAGDFRPMVTMSQNLLPFEWRELRRFGWSVMTVKMMLLRFAQARTFRLAEGLIFLTQYGREAAMRVAKAVPGRTMIIPHGVHDRFVRPPVEQLHIDQFSDAKPFRILYVSVIDVYKHQWHVAEAVAQLRSSGLPVVLDLVGPADPTAMHRLMNTLDRLDSAGKFVHYLGKLPYAELHSHYAAANLFVFASSCETFGQILTEAMSAGLPIACSNRSAMPELLGKAGLYFDPENVFEIKSALQQLIQSPKLRRNLANASFERVREYSWQRCADETLGFLAEVADANAAESLAAKQT